jgi:hypothetical protein
MTRCIIASVNACYSFLHHQHQVKQAIVKHLLCDQSKMELSSKQNDVVTTSVTKTKTTVKVTGKP